MTVADALEALAHCGDADAAVIVMRHQDGELTAAPVMAVALDEDSRDASLLMGEFTDAEDALEDATTVGDVRDALREIGETRGSWPLFSTDSDDVGAGGSIVGYSTNDEVEIFAFLQGPKSAWDGPGV